MAGLLKRIAMGWVIDDFYSTVATGHLTSGAWVVLIVGAIASWALATLLVRLIKWQIQSIAMRWRSGRMAPTAPDSSKKPNGGWSLKLARPIVLRNDKTIETLGDASALVVALSEHKGREGWQSVATTLLEAAQDSRLIDAATSDLELTLFVRGLLSQKHIGAFGPARARRHAT
jgi:hypothetical protein